MRPGEAERAAAILADPEESAAVARLAEAALRYFYLQEMQVRNLAFHGATTPTFEEWRSERFKVYEPEER